MMREIRVLEMLKKPFKKFTPLEMIAADLASAHLQKLEAEFAIEYAQAVLELNIARIERLNKRLEEYK